MAKRNPASRRKSGTKNHCQKYGIAITNYVLGEDLRMPPEELYNHLKSCPKCLDELKDWQDVYATMRTEAYHKTPEAKKRYQELLEKIRALPAGPSLPVTLPPVIDTERIVGLAAGEIYDCLKKNGPIPLPRIRKNTGLEGYPFYEAMGWLNREKKVIVRGKGEQPEYAELAPSEREKYQSR